MSTIRERVEALRRLGEGRPVMGGGMEADQYGDYLWRDDVLALADALDAEAELQAIARGLCRVAAESCGDVAGSGYHCEDDD